MVVLIFSKFGFKVCMKSALNTKIVSEVRCVREEVKLWQLTYTSLECSVECIKPQAAPGRTARLLPAEVDQKFGPHLWIS